MDPKINQTRISLYAELVFQLNIYGTEHTLGKQCMFVNLIGMFKVWFCDQ